VLPAWLHDKPGRLAGSTSLWLPCNNHVLLTSSAMPLHAPLRALHCHSAAKLLVR
jgi:hypothetical protein